MTCHVQTAPKREPPSKPDVAALDRSPGHWRGLAIGRLEAAEACRKEGMPHEADRHARIASEYERRAAECEIGR